MDSKWSSADVTRFLGANTGCFLTHSLDESVRNGAASGGATSQILIELLKAGYVDGALVWTMGTRDGRPYSEPMIAQSEADVLAARTSRYAPAYFARDAMPLVQAFEGRLAVVALPCDATYLRRRMSKDAALDAKVRGILALFCGHNSLPELTEVTCARHGYEWSDLKDFTYRTGSWRGDLTMVPKEGAPKTVSTRQFTHFQNLHYFSEKKCLSCFDHFGFDADISLGDSWALGEKKNDIKPTVCVTRTPAGDEMFQIARGAMDVRDLSPEHVLAGNSRGMTYHFNVSARAKAATGLDHKINDRLQLPVSFLEKIIARIGVSNVLWSGRDANAKQTLIDTPFWKIKARIYAFKALQELNSYAFRRYPDSRQISIIGATLTGNQGAAAMLETTIGEVSQRFPEAEFVIHSYFPEADKAACSSPKVRFVDASPKALVLSAVPAFVDGIVRRIGLRWPNFLMPASLREIRNSRVLLDVSGISLADGREKFLPFNLLCNWPAMLVGTPVVKLSQAMGPMKGAATRLTARFLFKRMHKVFGRGATTMKMIEDAAPQDTRAMAADIAFLYREDYALLPHWSDTLDGLIADLKDSKEETIAISVSSVMVKMVETTGGDYVEAIASLVERLVGDGYRVVIFPNACREGTDSTRNNDIPIIEALSAKLGGARERVHLVTHVVNTAAIRRLLAEADALISSRFHAMVAALSLGTPTLVLGWSHKYEEVMDMFGGESRFIAAADMSIDAVSEAVGELLSNRELIRGAYAAHRGAVEHLSASQFEWLDGFLQPEADTSDEGVDDTLSEPLKDVANG